MRYMASWKRRLAQFAFATVIHCTFWIGAPCALAQVETPKAPPKFPPSLTQWSPLLNNPVFAGAGAGHWDAKIRERGWIMREGNLYRLWYTGYDGRRDGIKLLGYATSEDGVNWKRSLANPLERNHWVEDMMVVRDGRMYYMFAEGEHDNHAVMLTSSDGIAWTWEGELDVRAADGKTSAKRPCGTPAVLVANGAWYLFYEWGDKGVWLARTEDPQSRVWVNVQDEPVLSPGPGDYDKDMIAANQVFKRRDAYFMIYHGSGDAAAPRTWNTDLARSTDLVHWTKFPGNPIVPGDRSSGVIVSTPHGDRLYTMHDHVDAFEPAN